MKLLLSPQQQRQFEKTKRLFFNDEARALRNDPELREVMELGLINQLYEGWKNLEPRYGLRAMPKGKKGQPAPMGPIPREEVTPLKGYALVNDDPVDIDDEAEQILFLIDETDRMLTQGEQPGAFRTMRDDDREFVRQAIRNNVFSGSITGDSIAALGTKGRKYPASSEKAGQSIKAVWEEGQRDARGMSILLDKAEGVDVDLGSGTFGQEVDGMHRIAAANDPSLLTAVDNIRPGNASLNRAVGNLQGPQLRQTLINRKLNLRNQLFELENGMSPIQRGGIDKRTNRENLQQTRFDNSLDKLIVDIQGMSPEELAQKYKDSYVDKVVTMEALKE